MGGQSAVTVTRRRGWNPWLLILLALLMLGGAALCSFASFMIDLDGGNEGKPVMLVAALMLLGALLSGGAAIGVFVERRKVSAASNEREQQ
jgi:hypothetical protein